jgi:hypothetical protein
MPAPRRRVTQDEAPELLANWRPSEQPLREWCAENGLHGRSLRFFPDCHPPPAAIRLAEPARPSRATPEPLRLTLDGVVIDVPDRFNDQTLARVLAVVRFVALRHAPSSVEAPLCRIGVSEVAFDLHDPLSVQPLTRLSAARRLC